MTQRSFKKYIFTILLTAILLLGTCAVFNAVVDPYGMYRLITIPRVNVNKPSLGTRIRVLKAYEVRRTRPNSIILGTSRPHIGFRTSHEGWAKLAKRRYNLAFDGASAKEMYYYLVHAYMINPLKLVILGLDTYQLIEETHVRPDFDTSLLMNEHRFISSFKMALGDLKILTSFDALKNSIQTIKSQKINDTAYLSPDGQRIGDLYFRRPYEDFQKFGPRYYFDKFDEKEVEDILKDRMPKSKEKKSYHETSEEGKDPLTSLDYIKKIITFCQNKKIDLKIFFTPCHAHRLEIGAATGEWSSIEQAKRELVKILADDAKQHPNQNPISLFDFNGYSEITTEPLPERESRAEMKNFWDSSHFKENIGDLVLNRILNIENTQNSIPEDFGILLTEDNIESVIAQMRNRHDLYKKNHLQEIETIQSWVEDFKKKNNINE